MPKRKRSKNDYDDIRSEIKKLKKMLKRSRKRDRSESSSSESEESTTSKVTAELDELFDLENEDTQTESPSVETPASNTVSNDTGTNNTDNGPLATDNNQDENIALDKDILDILGDDPSTTVKYGPEIHKELASRLQHITTSGLTKETRKELQSKYLLPSNATLLGAPTLNREIKATLPETLVNRDKAIETKQKLLGSAIACLSQVTSQMIASKQKDNDLLKKLMDANRLLCDIQHSDSVTRRMFSMSVIKKDIKTQIVNSKIDKLLFGENLPEELKTAKAVSKSSAEIKSTPNYNAKKSTPSTSKASNLNSRAPAAPARKPPPVNTQQKTRPTASHQNQHARSSRTSSQPQKITNNRR